MSLAGPDRYRRRIFRRILSWLFLVAAIAFVLWLIDWLTS